MDALLKDIHNCVDDMVSLYIQNHLETQIHLLCNKYECTDIHKIRNALELDEKIYQKTQCSATTVLGNPCKYKSSKNSCYCIKHSKLMKTRQ